MECEYHAMPKTTALNLPRKMPIVWTRGLCPRQVSMGQCPDHESARDEGWRRHHGEFGKAAEIPKPNPKPQAWWRNDPRVGGYKQGVDVVYLLAETSSAWSLQLAQTCSSSWYQHPARALPQPGNMRQPIKGLKFAHLSIQGYLITEFDSADPNSMTATSCVSLFNRSHILFNGQHQFQTPATRRITHQIFNPLLARTCGTFL